MAAKSTTLLMGAGEAKPLLMTSCLVLTLLLSGCVTTRDKDGTEHHLVLGFGVISVKEAPDRAMVVTDTRVVGLHVSDRPGLKAGLGYSAATVTTVANGAEDVRAELSRNPFGPINIDVQKAKLAPAEENDVVFVMPEGTCRPSEQTTSVTSNQ